ncbi:MAG: zinc-binding dehydrogenase [Limnohabitans sp.]|uniref:zinc-binding dehydrogenase n=1 Tax=Limnohabitans sp. TaxID=1907725 RepID=UPI003BB0BC9F
MKTVDLIGHGGNEVVVVGERPMPERGAGQVLVRMHAATLNRVDLYMRDSGAGITHTLPQTMGLDGAGVIEAMDEGEPGLHIGQKVLVYPAVTCGVCEFCQSGEEVLCTRMSLLGEHRDGTLSEYIRVPARNLVPMPDSWTFEEAAALGVNHLTAWRMLVSRARLQAGESVLIFGIGGGVSLAGLQLAKAMGARVFVTSTQQDKLDRALALGADGVIHSREQDVVQEVMRLTGKRGVDVVFENVGQAVWDSALRSAVRGGRIVTCGATTGDQPGADLRRVFIRQLQILGSTLGNLEELKALTRFCEQQDLRPLIEKTYALDDIHAALDRLASGQQFGKLAVRIQG